MHESYPSFWWLLGRFVHPVKVLSAELPKDTQMQIVASAMHGCDMFLRYGREMKDLLPASHEKVCIFQAQATHWTNIFIGVEQIKPGETIENLTKIWDGFTITLKDELDRLPTFTATNKGNLSIHALVTGASKGYPQGVLELIDEFIVREIDQAGKCLAYEMPTSCGFHILRAVETGMKGYVHAATGKLPGIKNRNWGEYIFQLETAKAHSDLIDVLRVLKTKRNPLMHPTDNLEVDEAISLLCVCQAGMEALIADVRRRSLEIQFKESLKLMPTL